VPGQAPHGSVPTSIEAQDRFLDLLTATVCEVAVDANASEPGFLQYSTRLAQRFPDAFVQSAVGTTISL
jgi:hypothetical protein